MIALLWALQVSNPQQPYADALNKARKLAAEKHFELGCLLADRAMHDWAKIEFEAAVSQDPDHDRARTRLGFKADDLGRWSRDAAIVVKTGNKKDKASRERAEADYEAARAGKCREVAVAYEAAAAEGDKIKLVGEAQATRRDELDYDPSDAKLREVLGYKVVGDRWAHPKSAELFEAMTASAKSAPAVKPAVPDGEPFKEKSAVETKLNIVLEKRAGPHVLVESSYKNQDALGLLVRLVEATVGSYERVFRREKVLQTRIESVIFKTREEHEKFVDAFVEDERLRAILKKSNGRIRTDLHEKFIGDQTESMVQDHVVHAAVHTLVMYDQVAFRPWQAESTAYFFTRAIHGTAANMCTQLPSGTISGDLRKAFGDSEHWNAAVKSMVTDWTDPPVVEIFKSDLPGLNFARTLKAWSILEFLFREHPDKFVKFWDRLRDDPEDSGERALRDVFGWTPADLDTFWRIWVRSQP